MPPTVSPALQAVLDRQRWVLVSDDVERADRLAAADLSALRALAEDVEPLFDEINGLLDALTVLPSPDADQQDLQVLLNDLGQAGVEARLELDDRG